MAWKCKSISNIISTNMCVLYGMCCGYKWDFSLKSASVLFLNCLLSLMQSAYFCIQIQELNFVWIKKEKCSILFCTWLFLLSLVCGILVFVVLKYYIFRCFYCCDKQDLFKRDFKVLLFWSYLLFLLRKVLSKGFTTVRSRRKNMLDVYI